MTDLTAGFREGLRKGVTVLRIIGLLHMIGTNNFIVDYAAAIVRVAAEAALSAAFPDPGSDTEAPWLWWNGGSLFQATDDRNHDVVIDVKSRRAFRESDDRLYFIMDNVDAVSSLQFSFGIRILYALP